MGSVNSREEKIKQIAEYIINNIDSALENGWIKVYYQPVVRTLTGQLCGAESLARWIDPEQGLLSPGKFIGALEKSKQIHKLDCWIIDKVCSDIAQRLADNLDTVPVSVNLSKLDFAAADMLQVVEAAVEKYDIPKDYLHIEITESMIVSDAKLMSRMIDSFRHAGYEVWMDDFGSGYSSLNLLKDYHFDTLKMDMAFLSSFTNRSKAIMTSTITMAKDIGIMTLAEGVETQEQVNFLHAIGCGKLQGYFYGAPMPIEKFFDHIKDKGISIEPRQWHHYYQVASFHARHTEEPLEILEDDGEHFRTLFMNEAYMRQVFTKDYSLEELDRLIYQTKSPLVKKYREFANVIESTKNHETFYYTNDGNILCFQGKEVAEHAGKHIIKGSIRNISTDKNFKKQTYVDNKLKELNHLFDTVTVFNIESHTIQPLIGKIMYIEELTDGINVLDEQLEIMANNYVAAVDREKFKEFIDIPTLMERISASGKGFIENIFRLKQADGNYKWKELSIMLIPGTGGKEFLFCSKATTDDAEPFLSTNNSIVNLADYGLDEENSIRYSKMWENTVNNSSIKFFWKDKNRRYCGGSRAFLDYCNIKIDDILGKTDDELDWQPDKNTFADEDKAALEKGEVLSNSPGQCVINGIVHNILTFKSPLYENGQIIGVMGYFIDVDEELGYLDKQYNERRLDPVTGLMNVSTLAEVTKEYAHNYAYKGTNYALIILRNDKHHRIVEDYGAEFGDKLLKQMGEVIVKVTTGKCAIAKCIASDFAMVTDITDPEGLGVLINNLKTSLENIKKLDGNNVTLKINIGYKLRSDDGITDENMYTMVLQELM